MEAHQRTRTIVVVVMGVAGCGKTSVGQRLARRMAGGSQFIDADDHHPPSNIAKMRSGQPLSDADRMPWLQRLCDAVNDALTAPKPPADATTSNDNDKNDNDASNSNAVVLACSCLRKIYRDTLRSGIACDVLRFVFLAVPRDVALLRVTSRAGHFMPAALVHSQFATLEVPASVCPSQCTPTAARTAADLPVSSSRATSGNDEEADVVAVDASLPIDALCDAAAASLAASLAATPWAPRPSAIAASRTAPAP